MDDITGESAQLSAWRISAPAPERRVLSCTQGPTLRTRLNLCKRRHGHGGRRVWPGLRASRCPQRSVLGRRHPTISRSPSASSQEVRLLHSAGFDERRVHRRGPPETLTRTPWVRRELDRVTGDYVAHQVALKSDSLEVKTRLAKAEYEALNLQNQLATQKEQLNNLLGRDVPLAVVTRPCGAGLRPPAAGAWRGMVPVARGGRWRAAGTRRGGRPGGTTPGGRTRPVEKAV